MPIVVTESSAASQVGLILNPTSDGFAAELNIGDGAVYKPKGLAFPPPNPSPAYASSYDTEGSVSSDEAHYENREIVISLWVFGSSAGGLELALNDLYRMVGQVNREGGVLEFTTANGTVCYFDLEREGAATVAFDPLYTSKHFVEVECRFVARPFWRGAEVDLGTTSETSLPVVVLTESGIDGDVPALGRLVVTDTESGGKDRWTVIVGGQSRYYSADATAALFYQAEDLTPLGTSTDTAGATGASGTNVIRNTDLTTTYQAVLKSEIDATNAALTHKGTFRVWARLYRPTGNAGAVSVKLEWAVGDFTRTARNDDNVVAYGVDDREGVFTWANLGIVSIDPAFTRWEFRLLAKSDVVGDELDADCFVLIPTEVTYGEWSAKVRFENPSSYSDRDEFGQSAGALAGKTSSGGQTWAGAGDADDFSVETTGKTAQRTAVSDDDSVIGRFAVSGVAGFAAQVAQVDFKTSSTDTSGGNQLIQGVLARYTDTNNWLRAAVVYNSTSTTGMWFVVQKVVGGVNTLIREEEAPLIDAGTWSSVRLQVDASGRWYAWFLEQGTPTPSEPTFRGYDAALATGGGLASGKPGFSDVRFSAAAVTRNYDNFMAFAPTPNAAIFAGQTFTLDHKSATREDSGGSFPSPVAYPNGRFLKVPASGPEGRSTRLVVLPLANDPYTIGDAAAVHDTSAQLFVTPRGLVIPE